MLRFSSDDNDGLEVAEILPLLPMLGDVGLPAVRRREAPPNRRVSVLRRLDTLLDGPAATGEAKPYNVQGTDEEHVIGQCEPVGGGRAAKDGTYSADNSSVSHRSRSPHPSGCLKIGLASPSALTAFPGQSSLQYLFSEQKS
jgi:hypothetical protein